MTPWYRFVVAGVLCAACGGSDTTNPGGASSDPYGSLQLNEHTAVLSIVAPYNTLQLHATPHTLTGAAISNLPAPVYAVIGNDTKITVSATGLVHADSVSPQSIVVATLQDSAHNVTHTDTLYVTVTDSANPPRLTTFSIQPVAGDSLKVGIVDVVSTTYTPHLTATDAHGNDISSIVPMHYTTSDPSTALVDPAFGTVAGRRPGTVTITASTSLYGVAKVDSIRLRIGNPITGAVTMWEQASPTVSNARIRVFLPATLTVGVGAVVAFEASGGSVLASDVIFDDSTIVQPSINANMDFQFPTGSRNIRIDAPPSGITCPNYVQPDPNDPFSPFLDMCSQTRTFPTAGTYHYHSALYGSTGTIVVSPP